MDKAIQEKDRQIGMTYKRNAPQYSKAWTKFSTIGNLKDGPKNLVKMEQHAKSYGPQA